MAGLRKLSLSPEMAIEKGEILDGAKKAMQTSHMTAAPELT
jgi:hypothetical protein